MFTSKYALKMLCMVEYKMAGLRKVTMVTTSTFKFSVKKKSHNIQTDVQFDYT